MDANQILHKPFNKCGQQGILRKDFFQNLVSIDHKHRYGNALHNLHEYQWLEGLFVKVLSNPLTSDLLGSLKKWDYYSYQHSFDVFLLGTLLGKRIGIANLEDFAVGLFLHDIGKVKISASILRKPGKLTNEEITIIKKHTTFGYDLLKEKGYSEAVCRMAKNHHEKESGKGYPSGIKNIAKEVAVLSMVDIYSALTLDRPYRKAYQTAKALDILLTEYSMDSHSIYKEFYKLIGMYPVHTIVELSNGYTGKVVETHDDEPFYPIVQLLKPSEGKVKLNRHLSVKNVLSIHC